jgi:two-component system, NarL family, sensor histidine kinase BarA
MTSAAINWPDCVKQSNNKPELAQELLNMFAAELPQLHHKIKQAQQSNDIPDLKDTLHKLHGASCYCGTNQLKKLLNSIEQSIHRLDNIELDSKLKPIYNEITKIQQELKSKSYL